MRGVGINLPKIKFKKMKIKKGAVRIQVKEVVYVLVLGFFIKNVWLKWLVPIQ